MARKEIITQQMILDTAFEMVREDGFESVTARKVAAAVGCSTQPIFRLYKNMEELQAAVYDRAVDYFSEYIKNFEKSGNVPFSGLGLAYISFARDEKNYFRLLFVNEYSGRKSMYEVLNGNTGNVVTEINKARAMGCKDPGDMFMRMWIFIHGSACMTLTDDYDLSDEETLELLRRSYAAFAET